MNYKSASIKLVENDDADSRRVLVCKRDRGFQHIPTRRTAVQSPLCYCIADFVSDGRCNFGIFDMSNVIITRNGLIYTIYLESVRPY